MDDMPDPHEAEHDRDLLGRILYEREGWPRQKPPVIRWESLHEVGRETWRTEAERRLAQSDNTRLSEENTRLVHERDESRLLAEQRGADLAHVQRDLETTNAERLRLARDLDFTRNRSDAMVKTLQEASRGPTPVDNMKPVLDAILKRDAKPVHHADTDLSPSSRRERGPRMMDGRLCDRCDRGDYGHEGWCLDFAYQPGSSCVECGEDHNGLRHGEWLARGDQAKIHTFNWDGREIGGVHYCGQCGMAGRPAAPVMRYASDYEEW